MRVEISEVTDAYQHYKSQVNSVKSALSETTSSLLGLANTDGFSGKLANNVRSYIDEVDLNAIGLILKSYDELDHEFQSALNTFASDIDSDDSAIVDTDTLSDVITALDRYDSDIGTILTEADAAIMTASAFANVVVPKSSALEHAMLETRKTVSDLKLAMEAFDGMTNIKSKLAEINLVSSTLITPILKQAGSVHNNAFTDSDLNQSTTKEGKRLTKLRDEKFGDINKEAQNIHQKRQQQKRIETAMYNLKHNSSMDYYSEPKNVGKLNGAGFAGVIKQTMEDSLKDYEKELSVNSKTLIGRIKGEQKSGTGPKLTAEEKKLLKKAESTSKVAKGSVVGLSTVAWLETANEAHEEYDKTKSTGQTIVKVGGPLAVGTGVSWGIKSILKKETKTPTGAVIVLSALGASMSTGIYDNYYSTHPEFRKRTGDWGRGIDSAAKSSKKTVDEDYSHGINAYNDKLNPGKIH